MLRVNVYILLRLSKCYAIHDPVNHRTGAYVMSNRAYLGRTRQPQIWGRGGFALHHTVADNLWGRRRGSEPPTPRSSHMFSVGASSRNSSAVQALQTIETGQSCPRLSSGIHLNRLWSLAHVIRLIGLFCSVWAVGRAPLLSHDLCDYSICGAEPPDKRHHQRRKARNPRPEGTTSTRQQADNSLIVQKSDTPILSFLCLHNPPRQQWSSLPCAIAHLAQAPPSERFFQLKRLKGAGNIT